MKHARILLLLASVAFIIAACSSDSATPDGAPTIAPTAMPVEAPTEPPAEVPAEVPTEEPPPPAESASPLNTMEFVVDPNLVDVTWEWFQRSMTTGSEVLFTVPNPENYTVFFNADQTFNAQLDCNNASGAYATSGAGKIFMKLGPMTTAACPPESLSDDMLNMFGPTQSYVYDAGGDVVIFTWVAGGPWDYYRKVGSSSGSADPEGEFALIPEQITLDTEGLGTTWRAVVVLETLYDQSLPPGPVGMAEHIEILFGGAIDPAEVGPGDPIMYIIPVNPYRKMWNDAGNNAVTLTLQEIQQLNFVLVNPAPTLGYPVLPFEQVGAGFNDLAVQVGKAVPQDVLNTTSATQDGYRFVGRWNQDVNPVTNTRLRYVYQGFSNDGIYLVSFWWPVSTSELPNEISDLPAEQAEQFNADPMAHINGMAGELNNLSADQWQPDLDALDAVVGSLQIESMTPAGLLDTQWQWTQGPSLPDNSDVVGVPGTSNYWVTYSSDGTIEYIADCNSAVSTFDLNNGGMTGAMLVEPGSLTAADCGSDSLAAGFVNALAASQSYRVWAGGNEMELVLPAGGGVLMLRDADAPTLESPPAAVGEGSVTGAITFADSTTLPEGSVATVQFQDVSLADAPANIIGEQIISNPGAFPIAFDISYDKSQIQENHTYSLSARITDAAGSLLYINDTHFPIITSGNPTENVEIPVIQVGG